MIPARERMSPAESIFTFPDQLNFPRELHSGRIDVYRACRKGKAHQGRYSLFV